MGAVHILAHPLHRVEALIREVADARQQLQPLQIVKRVHLSCFLEYAYCFRIQECVNEKLGNTLKVLYFCTNLCILWL